MGLIFIEWLALDSKFIMDIIVYNDASLHLTFATEINQDFNFDPH